MGFYEKDILLNHFKMCLDGETCEKVIVALENAPSTSAIPVDYICQFASMRDPVYQSNLSNLVQSYMDEVKKHGESS